MCSENSLLLHSSKLASIAAIEHTGAPIWQIQAIRDRLGRERKRKTHSLRLIKWMSSYSRCAELSGKPFGSSCRITYSNQQPIKLSNYSPSCRPNKWLWQNTERSRSEIPENSLSYFSLSCSRLVRSFRYTTGEAKCSLMAHSGVNDSYICRIERKTHDSRLRGQISKVPLYFQIFPKQVDDAPGIPKLFVAL